MQVNTARTYTAARNAALSDAETIAVRITTGAATTVVCVAAVTAL